MTMQTRQGSEEDGASRASVSGSAVSSEDAQRGAAADSRTPDLDHRLLSVDRRVDASVRSVLHIVYVPLHQHGHEHKIASQSSASSGTALLNSRPPEWTEMATTNVRYPHTRKRYYHNLRPRNHGLAQRRSAMMLKGKASSGLPTTNRPRWSPRDRATTLSMALSTTLRRRCGERCSRWT